MVDIGEVGVKDGIAVRVVLLINQTIETALVMSKNGKLFEPAHSRTRRDKQVRFDEDVYIPPADYKLMFKKAGAILGKPRKKA